MAASPSLPASHAESSPGPHVHGSVWPLVVALGATLLLAGLLVPAALWLGLAVLLLAVGGWVREDLATLAPVRGLRSERWYAALFLIASEVMVFGVLFTYYFWVQGFSPSWPPEGIPPPELAFVGANTLVLLASGWTGHVAQRALEARELPRFRRALGATVLLGALFLAGQAYEYVTAGFGPQGSTYGTAFFALTGTHGLHVLAGLVALGLVLGLALRGWPAERHASGVSGALLYWHFVDAVWVVLFAVLYLRWV